MGTKIQYKLWKLANYDCFLMQYCPVIYNKVAGIGLFFLFQILVVFASVITAWKVFASSFLIFGFLIATIVTYIFYQWMKFLNEIHHSNTPKGIFVVQFLINLLLALILSIPFCLLLFDHQILFQLYLKTGKMTLGNIEQLWLKPYGLYESWFAENDGNIILFICIANLIMIAFIFITPYLLILKNKKSVYTLVKQNYEQNFY
ncbi:MAG: hypothetical protein KH117_16905 [Dysgonomonas sp.]|uniref:hypothetical protein n=1 Tax=Dysgonomonas sp. TaxID=1891233 RepID=UPI00257FA207|nr:hypothetical protein [Dysgonomonas sp.]MBS7122658.1 hypothetical protein [Dysgonomonas sp.]